MKRELGRKSFRFEDEEVLWSRGYNHWQQVAMKKV
jgi:hypothetical protein